MEKKSHNCPICNKELKIIQRYPDYVCKSCAERVTDEHGNKLNLGNIGIWGGYKAVYSDTTEGYNSHTCYIDGVKCYADEARFGGIVIQIVKTE